MPAGRLWAGGARRRGSRGRRPSGPLYRRRRGAFSGVSARKLSPSISSKITRFLQFGAGAAVVDAGSRNGAPGGGCAARVNAAVWVAATFGAHAIGAAIFIALVGFALTIEPQRLVGVYLQLAYCGFVFAGLSYWAFAARRRPRVCAARFAVALFGYGQVAILVLGASAVKLGLVSSAEAYGGGFIPAVSVLTAVGCFFCYFPAREMLSRGAGQIRAGENRLEE